MKRACYTQGAKLAILWLFLFLLVTLFSGCGFLEYMEERSSESSTATKKSVEFTHSRTAEIRLNVGEVDSHNFIVQKAKNSYATYSLDELEFISDDPSIVTIKAIAGSQSTSIHYKLEAIAPGKTTIYVRTTDGSATSTKRSVTVSEASTVGQESVADTEIKEGPSGETIDPAALEASAQASREAAEQASREVAAQASREAAAKASREAAEQASREAAARATPAPTATPRTITVTSGLTFRRNQYATISINAQPGALYYITVYYNSGPSTAQGLEPKRADANGNVSWTWKIGGRTAAGTYSVVIEGNGERIQKYITVVVN